MMLTQERLKELLEYTPETGIFTWKARPSNRVRVGDIAGHLEKKDGYIMLGIGGVLYRAHRLAWLYMTGDFPPKEKDIDHKNGLRADNRWANIRLAERYENLRNMRSRGGTSEHKGVSFDRSRGLWKAQIQIMGKNTFIGRYASEQDAALAYNARAAIEFGEFAGAAQ